MKKSVVVFVFCSVLLAFSVNYVFAACFCSGRSLTGLSYSCDPSPITTAGGTRVYHCITSDGEKFNFNDPCRDRISSQCTVAAPRCGVSFGGAAPPDTCGVGKPFEVFATTGNLPAAPGPGAGGTSSPPAGPANSGGAVGSGTGTTPPAGPGPTVPAGSGTTVPGGGNQGGGTSSSGGTTNPPSTNCWFDSQCQSSQRCQGSAQAVGCSCVVGTRPGNCPQLYGPGGSVPLPPYPEPLPPPISPIRIEWVPGPNGGFVPPFILDPNGPGGCPGAGDPTFPQLVLPDPEPLIPPPVPIPPLFYPHTYQSLTSNLEEFSTFSSTPIISLSSLGSCAGNAFVFTSTLTPGIDGDDGFDDDELRSLLGQSIGTGKGHYYDLSAPLQTFTTQLTVIGTDIYYGTVSIGSASYFVTIDRGEFSIDDGFDAQVSVPAYSEVGSSKVWSTANSAGVGYIATLSGNSLSISLFTPVASSQDYNLYVTSDDIADHFVEDLFPDAVSNSEPGTLGSSEGQTSTSTEEQGFFEKLINILKFWD